MGNPFNTERLDDITYFATSIYFAGDFFENSCLSEQLSAQSEQVSRAQEGLMADAGVILQSTVKVRYLIGGW